VQDVAFANPDGSTALVAFNGGDAAQTFSVRWGDRWFGYTLAAGAAATASKADPAPALDTRSMQVSRLVPRV